MRQGQKILTAGLWVLTVLALISFVGAGLWRRNHDQSSGMELMAGSESDNGQLPMIAPAPVFSLLDQNSVVFTSESLRGRTYIADFVFTRCAGPCPIMTERMASMEKQLSNPKVHFVTITVDPEFDTPAVLKQYAREHHADESRWHFLGGPKEAVFATARGMLITAMPTTANDSIIHDERFILVDGRGSIRGFYHSKDEARMTRLLSDAQRIASESQAWAK